MYSLPQRPLTQIIGVYRYYIDTVTKAKTVTILTNIVYGGYTV